MILAVSATAPGAQPANFNHTANIEATLRQLGGIGNIGKASGEQIGQLVYHFSERAQFFQDLYEYECRLVRDHAVQRDSIGKRGGAAVAAAPYFLGRALQELGQKEAAAAAYAAAIEAAPEPVRALASIWKATLTGGGGGWRRDLVAWRDGQPMRTAPCPPATPVCDLFEAILAEDAAAIYRTQRAVLQNAQPDYRAWVKTAADSFHVDFFDPLPRYLLSVADYQLVVHALKDAGDVPSVVDAIRGVALMRTHHLKEAVAVLRRAGSGPEAAPLAIAALGEALAQQGGAAEAVRAWTGAPPSAANFVVDTRARARAEPAATIVAAVLRQYNGERARRFAMYANPAVGGEALGRALLRVGRPKEALDVLDAVRPPSYGRDLNKARPDVLVLASRARFEAGRRDALPELYPLARGDLAGMADAFPSVIPALTILELLTAPENVGVAR